MRGFQPSEFAERTLRLQTAMAAEGLDAVLVTTEADVRYITGFLTRFWESPSRAWYVIVPASGKPIAVIPSIGAALMGTTWVEDIRTWRAPDLEDDGVGLLSATLDEVLGGSGGRVGLPAGHESNLRMPLNDFWALQALRPERQFVSDGNIVRYARSVKTPAEVEKIRAACAVAGRAFDRMGEVLREGLRKEEYYRGFQRLCLEEGADFVPYIAGGHGEWGYGDIIAPADDSQITAGDVVMLDTGVLLDGYFSDFDRNFSFGKAPRGEVQDAFATLVDAVDAGFAAAKPGARASDLFAAMDQVVTGGKNSADSGRFGHGLGLQLTEWPSLIPDEHTVLVEGMVLTLEPSIVTTADGQLLVHEENIVITDAGAEFLSPRAPREFKVF
ncbi:MAG: M24 family metallopeptidase [Alphaproteobacteria bacterium]